MHPVVRLLVEGRVRTSGTMADPLFSAADIGKLVGDANYDRMIRGRPPDEVQQVTAADSQGRVRRTLFFTTAGLHMYLVQSRSPLGESFRRSMVSAISAECGRELAAVRFGPDCEDWSHEGVEPIAMDVGDPVEKYVAQCLVRLKIDCPADAPDELGPEDAWFLTHFFMRGRCLRGYSELRDRVRKRAELGRENAQALELEPAPAGAV